VAPSAFGTWAKGYTRRPSGRREVSSDAIVTALPAGPGHAVVPFIGLAEGMVVAAFREAEVSMQHIRRSVAILGEQIGVAHALASKRLCTDGAKVLFDYSEHRGDVELAGLTEVVSRQRVFPEVLLEYLRRIE